MIRFQDANHPDKWQGWTNCLKRRDGLLELHKGMNFSHPKAPKACDVRTKQKARGVSMMLFFVTDREAAILHKEPL